MFLGSLYPLRANGLDESSATPLFYFLKIAAALAKRANKQKGKKEEESEGKNFCPSSLPRGARLGMGSGSLCAVSHSELCSATGISKEAKPAPKYKCFAFDYGASKNFCLPHSILSEVKDCYGAGFVYSAFGEASRWAGLSKIRLRI